MDKCELEKTSIEWFGNIFSAQGMSKDPRRVEAIRSLKTPKDKKGVKSFLQTVQFCQPFLRPEDGRSYADVTKPLRRLTSDNVKFEWDRDCEKSFRELKHMLCSDKSIGLLGSRKRDNAVGG